jgi:hypothetical protein
MLNPTPTAALPAAPSKRWPGSRSRPEPFREPLGPPARSAHGPTPPPFGSFLRGWEGHEGCGLRALSVPGPVKTQR